MRLSDTLYERLRGEWEDRFEARFGFWRGLADEAVARYLDCGIRSQNRSCSSSSETAGGDRSRKVSPPL